MTDGWHHLDSWILLQGSLIVARVERIDPLRPGGDWRVWVWGCPVGAAPGFEAARRLAEIVLAEAAATRPAGVA